MFIVYDIIFLFCAVVYLPYLLGKGKWHRGFYARLGLAPALPLSQDGAGRRVVWIHAVSVGEVLAILDLIDVIRGEFPGCRIILSTVTQTGNELAKARLKDKCAVIFAPLDFSWAVRKYIKVIQPEIYIAAETEIWPNLYLFLKKNKVPIVQVNGRISDKAFGGYKKFSFLTRTVLGCVHSFCMQSPLDAQRVIALGADKEKVYVVGNLKFDNLPGRGSVKKDDFGFAKADRLFIAGSTHPGEEEIVMDIFGRLIPDFPDLRLVIAPRHVERTEEILKLARQSGLDPARFSEFGKGRQESRTVIVVDTIGHLRDLYSLADVVFIGKTLTVGGGQNIIEPLYFGKPTFVGPHTQNFKDISRIFLEAGALVQVQNADELFSQVRDVLKNPERTQEMASVAGKVIKENRGATDRTMSILTGILRA